MRIKALGIDIPDKPVDRFVLSYFEVTHDDLTPITLTYYSNCSWKEYAPDDDRTSAPLVDDWMVTRGNSTAGRLEGWNEVANFESTDSRKLFVDHAAAKRHFLKRLSETCERKKRALDEAKRKYELFFNDEVECHKCRTKQKVISTYQRCSSCPEYVTWM